MYAPVTRRHCAFVVDGNRLDASRVRAVDADAALPKDQRGVLGLPLSVARIDGSVRRRDVRRWAASWSQGGPMTGRGRVGPRATTLHSSARPAVSSSGWLRPSRLLL